MTAAHSAATGVSAAAHSSAAARAKNDPRDSSSNTTARAPRTATLSATPATGIASLLSLVRRNQGAHNGICASQRPAYSLIGAVKLCRIVGQDDDSAARIPAAFAPDVVSR